MTTTTTKKSTDVFYFLTKTFFSFETFEKKHTHLAFAKPDVQTENFFLCIVPLQVLCFVL
jgi:hypothetical protein